LNGHKKPPRIHIHLLQTATDAGQQAGVEAVGEVDQSHTDHQGDGQAAAAQAEAAAPDAHHNHVGLDVFESYIYNYIYISCGSGRRSVESAFLLAACV